MSQPLFGWPFYSDVSTLYTPAFSGGGWSATLPLTNLQDARLHKVARSLTASLANAQFDLDLGRAVAGIRIIALVGHNFTTAAKVRLTLDDTAGFGSPTYGPTAWLDVFGTVYPAGALPAWHPSAGSLLITAEDAVDYPIGFTHVLAAAAASSRYVRVEVDDTANPAGYIQAGRVVVAPGWQPTHHPDTGAELGWETSSRAIETDGGSTIKIEKARRRVASLRFGDLPVNEALVSFFEMQRRLGTARQLYFVFDPDDTANLHRRSLLCVQRQLTPLQYPHDAAHNTVPVALVEEL